MPRLPFFSLACLCFLSCVRPPLSVRQEGGSVIIDVATLGEYSSAVQRLRITDQTTKEIVWEILASTGTARLWKVELSLGVNPSDPPRAVVGTFGVVLPKDVGTFELKSGVEYKIEVWGEGSRPAKEIVTLVPADQSP